jgi:hypothetical protein
MNTEHLIQIADFQVSFEWMQREAAAINLKNGFTLEDALAKDFEQWFGEHVSIIDSAKRFSSVFASFRNARAGLNLSLITGEISEALEAVRKRADDHIPNFSAEEAECADAVIRLMNYATDRKLRLAEAIVAKNEFNRNRPDHTNRTGEHGKRGKRF